jgi:hypothetical protein
MNICKTEELCLTKKPREQLYAARGTELTTDQRQMVLLLDTTSKEVWLEGLSIRNTAFVQATSQTNLFIMMGLFNRPTSVIVQS